MAKDRHGQLTQGMRQGHAALDFLQRILAFSRRLDCDSRIWLHVCCGGGAPDPLPLSRFGHR